jgi:hypothetical protein
VCGWVERGVGVGGCVDRWSVRLGVAGACGGGRGPPACWQAEQDHMHVPLYLFEVDPPSTIPSCVPISSQLFEKSLF